MKRPNKMRRLATGTALALVTLSLAGIGFAGASVPVSSAVETASLLEAYAGPVPSYSGASAPASSTVQAATMLEAYAGPVPGATTQYADVSVAETGEEAVEASAATDVKSESAGADVASFDWASSDCASCHVEGQDDAATSLASSHIALGVSCTSCHTDEATLEEIHASVDSSSKTPKRLKETTVESDSCTAAGCHDDQDALAEATADVTLLTDEEGVTVNPHALPDTESHASITCGECHGGHAEADPQGVCLSCHHENVYQCGTCHD
jgi:hypothetical protein